MTLSSIARTVSFAYVLALLTGCAILTRTERIEVPLVVPCDPPGLQAPSRPIDGVNGQADVFEHIRALWATVEVLEGYVGHLEAAVGACRP